MHVLNARRYNPPTMSNSASIWMVIRFGLATYFIRRRRDAYLYSEYNITVLILLGGIQKEKFI